MSIACHGPVASLSSVSIKSKYRRAACNKSYTHVVADTAALPACAGPSQVENPLWDSLEVSLKAGIDVKIFNGHKQKGQNNGASTIAGAVITS